MHVYLSKDTLPARKYFAMRLGTLDIDAVCIPRFGISRCGDGSTPQDKDFNDCVHVYLSKDTLPARKYLAMRLGTFALLERWISMRFGSPKVIDPDAETAQLHRHGSNDYVHVLSSEGVGTDAAAESEVTSVRKDTTSNASRVRSDVANGTMSA